MITNMNDTTSSTAVVLQANLQTVANEKLIATLDTVAQVVTIAWADNANCFDTFTVSEYLEILSTGTKNTLLPGLNKNAPITINW